MNFLTSQASRQSFFLIFLAFITIVLFTLPTPALATDGRTAVGLCIDSTATGARCGWSVSKTGEIDICNKNGCVHCASATSECTVAIGQPRPGRPLPVGTKVETVLGAFEVAPSTFTFTRSCKKRETLCPLRGCVQLGKCDFPK